MTMNTIELTNKLKSMAMDQSKYAMDCCVAIINVIIAQYLTKVGYMEEHAIKTFDGFLEGGILTW